VAPFRSDTTEQDTTEQDTTERDTVERDTVERVPAGRRSPVRRLRPVGTDSSGAAAPLNRVTPLPDTLESDTLESDTLESDTLRRVRRYRPGRGPALFPSRDVPAARRTADLLAPRFSFWSPELGARYEHRLALDSTGTTVTARARIGEETVAPPLRVARSTYRRARRQQDLRAGWASIGRERRRRTREAGVGVSINVPGGRESAFTTIFGKNEVSLDINGQADINAGLDYRRSDQQAQVTGSPTQINPDFKQDLRLGITGSIGDKLQVDVNWDTQSQFDYQNQVKLSYTGYEDEIVQKVEAGNVFLNTDSQLIDGGQALFGIKSQFQLGGLRLTTIASQQEGQSNTLNIEGGARRTRFDRSALDYDARRHFFLGYYFRNNWNTAHEDPQVLRIDNLDRITKLQVWRSKDTGDEQAEEATALVDLGEPDRLLTATDDYDASGEDALPAPDNHQYDASFLDRIRAGNVSDSTLAGRVATDFDYYEGEFKRLRQGEEYTFDRRLGYLSLNQSLRNAEALAVAFEYRLPNGQTVQVGDFEGEGGGERLVLKLLRPGNLKAAVDEETAAWYLQMRNIYELRGRNINADGFELGLEYNPSGSTSQPTLQDLSGQATLLEQLGLDRQGADGQPGSDGRFDFNNGRTIDRDEGLLIFPYLQPFGARLRQVVQENTPEGEDLTDDYGLDALGLLYREKPDDLQEATERSKIDKYRNAGSTKRTAQEFYDLRAFNGVVEGSVTVTANGTPLTEGADYQVDYQGGTVTITNESYLGPGSEISIDYEKNALVNLQKKTLLGARADYRLRDNLRVGATLMRLSQQSPADKLRIGQEPIKNTIWGVDAALELEPRWLTRAVDALPLVQTKAPSTLELSAEFARLQPGHTDTQAFERTRRRLREDENRDFTSDELNGISYIDDFEGFENTFSLKSQIQSWRLAAAPDRSYQPPTASTNSPALNANNWRGALTWYQLNNNVVEELADAESYNDDLKKLVQTTDVFPDRDTRGEVSNTLRTLDLYFDPARRGPYNYTEDLRGFLRNPEDAWGGMTKSLPEGQKDFGGKNIEFIEFVFRPYPRSRTAADEAALYLDLGRLSEDIIPNGTENDEDGLALTDFGNIEGGSRLPLDNRENRAVTTKGGVTEDLGLDGLASYTGSGTYGPAVEQAQFGAFLDDLPAGGSARVQAEAARARRDPSGDDYRFYEDDAFFENDALFPGGASFQERFLFYQPGLELNSYQAQNTLAAEFTSGRGNTRNPDAENFGFDQLRQRGDYFQYRIPLSEHELDERARPNTPGDFIVGEIEGDGGEGTGWYKARIPVATPTDSIGSPDLSFVEHIRLWTTGHRAPMTLRFATLELVGSQWRKSESVSLTDEEPTDGDENDKNDDSNGAPELIDDSRLAVTSINNEEDSGIYERPRRAVVGQRQVASGRQQSTREQSLVLRVEDLRRGQKRAIFKNVQRLNLLKYGNLRLFTHLHSATDDFENIFMGDEQAARAKGVELFVRFGTNETSDYYEYRQPLTPTMGELGALPSETLWYPLDGPSQKLANEMNLHLPALNQLKVARDRRDDIASNEVFWSDLDDNVDSTSVSLDPALSEFAPQGARLAVKGTPSLQDVSSLVIGVRVKENARCVMTGDACYEDLTLWVNELRATDYDEKSGWKATANARIDLADFAKVRANLDRQTDGWGELASTLGQRRQTRRFDWNVRTTIFAHKLLPATAGWEIPITLELGSRTATPRYAPNRGDVLLSDVLTQADEAAGRSRGALRRAAQTHTSQRRLNARLSKTGSDSPWLRYTLDNVSLLYTLTQSGARDPSSQIDDRWQWNADLQYRHSFEQARTVQPLSFLEGLPLVGALAGTRFNYVPESIDFFSGFTREASERQDRPNNDLLSSSAADSALREPIRDTHTFDHQRSFDLRYNPFDFVNLSFNTQTNQSFNRAGAREQIRIVTDDDTHAGHGGLPFANEEEAVNYATSADGLGLAEDDFFVERNLNTYGPSRFFRRLFGTEGARTSRYTQQFTASFELPFGEGEAFNWISFNDVSYNASYGWENGARGSNLGATASNDVNVTTGITLHPQQFWRKFGFYRRLEKQQEAADQAGEEEEAGEDASPEGSKGDENGESEAGGEPETEDASRAGSGLSFDFLPDPVNLLRRAALAVTGIRDFSITYNATRSAESTHVGTRRDGTFTSGSHTLLGALQGEGPPLGYRFGLGRRIGTGLRLPDGEYQLTDDLNDSNELRARTRLDFSQNFQVQLNWEMDWSRKSSYTNLRAGEQQTRTLTGSGASSVWAFGGGFRDFIARQFQKLADRRASADAGPGDGAGVPLTNASISEDFRSAFSSSLGRVGESGFLAVPLPSWQVTYSGLSQWPLLGAVTQSVRLTHSYDAEYAGDFRALTAGSDTSTVEIGTGGEAFDFLRAPYEGQRLSVQERFQPLVGMEVSWKGGLRTSVEWVQTNTFSTRPAAREVVEDRTSEISFTADYRKQGLDIPFLPFGDLENQITFGLTASRTVERERDFLLRDALADAGATDNPGAYDPSRALSENTNLRTSSTRLKVAPKLSYRFSTRVSAEFVVRYERFDGNRRPSYSNIDGGFNVSVSLRE
jgi:cell surface protein SprA